MNVVNPRKWSLGPKSLVASISKTIECWNCGKAEHYKNKWNNAPKNKNTEVEENLAFASREDDALICYLKNKEENSSRIMSLESLVKFTNFLVGKTKASMLILLHKIIFQHNSLGCYYNWVHWNLLLLMHLLSSVNWTIIFSNELCLRMKVFHTF